MDYPSQMTPRKLPLGKQLLFSLLPAAVLFGLVELTVRLLGDVSASWRSWLPEERVGLAQDDLELFWSLKPNTQVEYQGVRVRTNELGLRDEPVSPKRPGEIRILSLGESTSFGYGVEFEQIYAQVLQRRLNAQSGSRRYNVLNAAVTAYSSFQSLLYLKSRGLALEPDAIILYHEGNDQLPTTMRTSAGNELSLNWSDKQWYEHRHRSWDGFAYRWLASYRALRHWTISRQLRAHRARSFEDMILAALEDRRLPTRVRDNLQYPERLWVLEQFYRTCQEHGLHLVLVHPAYRSSERHRCTLTEFARQRNVPMLDVMQTLRESENDWDSLFLDSMHLTPEGHRLVGEALGRLIEQEGWWP